MAKREDIADLLARRYVLFSCEGTAEGVIIDRLLQSGKTIVPLEHVVRDTKTFRNFTRLRKAGDIADRFLHVSYHDEECDGLLIARIVDSRTARFSLPRSYTDDVEVATFVTAPEIEMLVVIAERHYDDWVKHGGHMKPSEYCARVLGKPEVKREDFLKGYWTDVEKLEFAVREYSRRRGKRKGDELMLADLLK